MQKGQLEISNFRAASNKLCYALTPKGVAGKTARTSRFLQSELKEYDALKAEIESLPEDLELGADMGPASTAARRLANDQSEFHAHGES